MSCQPHRIISGRQKTKSKSVPGVKCPLKAQNNLSKQRTKSQSVTGVKCPVNLTEQSEETERTKSQSAGPGD